MRHNEGNGDGVLERAGEAFRLAAEEQERTQEQLAAVRALIAEASERDLALHRSTLAAVAELRRELERAKKRIDWMATARR